MKTKKIERGGSFITDFIPHRATWQKPVIKESKEIVGVRYYVGTDGKIYKASMFDAFFTPAVKTERRANNYKGANPNKKIIH